MITVITATNRPSSNTSRVARKYLQILGEKGVEYRHLSMEDVPHGLIFDDMFGKRTERFQQLLNEFIIPAKRFVVVAPEYNGSFPGVFKTFIDGIKPELFWGKKVAFVGVSAGRGGNVRGVDHLTSVFHHLRVEVFHNHIYVSRVREMVSHEGHFHHDGIDELIGRQIDGFMKF